MQKTCTWTARLRVCYAWCQLVYNNSLCSSSCLGFYLSYRGKHLGNFQTMMIINTTTWEFHKITKRLFLLLSKFIIICYKHFLEIRLIVKKNHVGPVVIEIFHYKHTQKVRRPVTFIFIT